MKRGNLIFVALLITNLFLISIIFTKGKTAPPVAIVLAGKEKGYKEIDSIQNSEFWNNYPYLVLCSEGKRIDTSISMYSHKGNGDEISGKILFRYFPLNKEDSVNMILAEIKKRPGIIILTDSLSYVDFKLRNNILKIQNQVWLLSKSRLNLLCDSAKKPYFFIVSECQKVKCVFFPRKEIIGIVEKYLNYTFSFVCDS